MNNQSVLSAPAGPGTTRAFSLLELLAAMVVLTILIVLLATVVNHTTNVWAYTRSKSETFREARDAFDLLTRRLSEAVLNPYLDYEAQNGELRTVANAASFTPARYSRQSELRFLSGPDILDDPIISGHAVFFQAPLGVGLEGRLPQLLNTCGFYVAYESDEPLIPAVLGPGHSRERFRLMQFVQRSEDLNIYRYTVGNPDYDDLDWFSGAVDMEADSVSIVAGNIVLLILLPMLSTHDQAAQGFDASSLAPNFLYDSTVPNATAALNSRNQLPPLIRVVMVAIDEGSASRLASNGSQELLTFIQDRFKNVGTVLNPLEPGLAKDLNDLEAWFVERRLTYRIFDSTINVLAARWSHEQSN